MKRAGPISLLTPAVGQRQANSCLFSTILLKSCCLVPELSHWPFCVVQMDHEKFQRTAEKPLLICVLYPSAFTFCSSLGPHGLRSAESSISRQLDPGLGTKRIPCPPGCFAEWNLVALSSTDALGTAAFWLLAFLWSAPVLRLVQVLGQRQAKPSSAMLVSCFN